MKFYLDSVFIFILVIHTNFSQQIFDSNEYCEFLKVGGGPKGSISLKRKTWSVSSTLRQMKNYEFILSFCGTIPPKYHCKPGASACILNRKNPEESILHAGEFFELIHDSDSDKDILRSVNGQRCSHTENFTVIVELNCEPQTKESPKILYLDECELRVEILSPACTPLCTARVNGHLIDLRGLKTLGAFQVQGSDTKSFALSFCSDAQQCEPGISICETSTSTIPIADTKSISISYDDRKQTNALILKAHHGSGKRLRINTEIYLTCKWNEPGIVNLKYLIPQKPSKTYRFEAKSALACIKMPMNCMVIDPFETYYVYDLKSLYNPNGAWKVANVTSGIMYINMCGPLILPSKNNICNEQSSQVCFQDKNKFTNLGTTAYNFHVTTDDTVRAYFTDGSPCSINSTIPYSTEIEFFCSEKENGPTLQSHNNCTYTVIWKTPASCPKNIAVQNNCLMSDSVGHLDLNDIYKTSDTTYKLSPDSYIRYNLCGPLKSLCNKNNDTSVCYVKNGKEHIVGYTSKELLRYNSTLILNLIGDKCDGLRSRSETKVYFTCSYLAPKYGNIQIKVVKDDCNFEMHIVTPLVCVKSINVGCTFYTKDSLYDLTPLAQSNTNYIVRDPNNPDVSYILHVCRSIIDTKDLYCPSYSAVCIKNTAVPHIKHMYKSIGNIHDSTELVVENNALILPYTSGSFCKTELTSSSTKIKFECSTKEERVRLLSKTACNYNFIWTTPYACPRKILAVKRRRSVNDCVYKHPVENRDLNFGGIELVLTIKEVKLQFDICGQNLSYWTENGTKCANSFLNTELMYNDQELYLKFVLPNLFEKDGQDNIIRIQLLCENSGTTEKTELRDIQNGTIYMRLFSNITCPIELPETSSLLNGMRLENYLTEVIEKHLDNYHNNITAASIQNFYTALSAQPSSCTVTNTNGIFRLKDMNFHVNSSDKNNYWVSFGEATSDCSGYICVNGINYLERTEDCPIVLLSDDTDVITLLFNSHQVCEEISIRLEIQLKCSSILQLPTVQETACKIVIIYPTRAACVLLEHPTLLSYSSSYGTPIGISLGIISFLVMVLIIAVVIKRLPCTGTFNLRRTLNWNKHKERIPIYYKDLSM